MERFPAPEQPKKQETKKGLKSLGKWLGFGAAAVAAGIGAKEALDVTPQTPEAEEAIENTGRSDDTQAERTRPILEGLARNIGATKERALEEEDRSLEAAQIAEESPEAKTNRLEAQKERELATLESIYKLIERTLHFRSDYTEQIAQKTEASLQNLINTTIENLNPVLEEDFADDRDRSDQLRGAVQRIVNLARGRGFETITIVERLK